MKKVEYVSGFAKSIIDVKVLASVFLQAIKKYGLLKGPSLLIDYFSDRRSLFKDIPARYVKKGKDYFVVAELPPVNHRLFAEYIIKDMAALRGMAKPTPAFAIVCISAKCPYKCHYCYNSEMHSDTEKLSVNQLVLTIDCLVDSGVRNIYLSGGEPMMRWDDLLQILERCQNQQVTFWLLTTGWGITDERIVQLVERDVTGIMVTLDSEKPETVAAIKGDSGAHHNAIQAIRLAAANGLIAVINSVFTKDILEGHNFERFVVFAGRNGAKFINCNTQKDTPNALEKNTPIFNPTDYGKLGKLTRQNNNKRRLKAFSLEHTLLRPALFSGPSLCILLTVTTIHMKPYNGRTGIAAVALYRSKRDRNSALRRPHEQAAACRNVPSPRKNGRRNHRV